MSEHVLIERRGHVMEITLNKPKVNAINHEMSKAVADAFVAFDIDDDLRVAILTAAGDRIFSAGWDLKALDRGDAKLDEWWDDGDYGYGGFAGLTENWTMNKPVIAALNGLVIGGGFEIAMACDMRFAALGKTKMNQMEVPIGIIPGGGGTQRLPSLVGYSRAAELILGGIDLDAQTGDDWGYFTRALPPEELDDYVEWLALRIASFDPAAVKGAKSSLLNSVPSLKNGLINESQIFSDLCYSQDGQRSLRRFLELGGQTVEGELRISDLSAEVAKE